MMNELEFRRRVQVNPFELDSECQAFLDAAEPTLRRDLEKYLSRCRSEHESEMRDIRTALQIPAPEGLAERALLRTAHQRQKRDWFAWLKQWQMPTAAFASATVAVAGGWLIYSSMSTPASAAEIAVEHIASEPAHMHLSYRGFQPPTKVEDVFAQIGLTLTAKVAKVDFASNCPIAGKIGAHLLLERDGKPVTVLVYPQRDKSQAGLAKGGEMVAMPYGSLAVFAEDATARREVLNFFKQNLTAGQLAMAPR